MLKVTFFGDSIFTGEDVSIHAGWVVRISRHLDDVAAAYGRNIVVTNASQIGRTTRQALEEMPYLIQCRDVNILIVQFGLNDCNVWMTDGGLPRVSPEAFAANLKEIVMRGRTFGARRVLLNNNHPTTHDGDLLPHSDTTFEQSNRRYNQIVRDVAAELGDLVELNDIEAEFDRVTGGDRNKLAPLLLADGLHLSRAGHDLYFDAVSDRIRRCVEECVLADRK